MQWIKLNHFLYTVICYSGKTITCMLIEALPAMEFSPPVSVIVGFRDIQI